MISWTLNFFEDLLVAITPEVVISMFQSFKTQNAVG